MSIFVTVNGIQTDVIMYANDLTGNITIRFADILLEGQIVNWTIFSNSATVNYNQITKDVFVADGSTHEFTLSSAPFYAIPTAYNVLVKVDNRILNPGYNIQFTIPANRQREYALEAFQQPGNALQVDDVNVFINGKQVFAPSQWRFDIFSSSVILSDAVGNVGDLVEIYVVTDGEYQLAGTALTIVDAPTDGQIVEVFKFSNHDIVGIERINYDVVSRNILLPEQVEYTTYNRLTVGEVTLRKSAADVQYVWVAINGELLTPSVDYYLVDNKSKLRLVRIPSKDDVIDIIHFTPQLSQPKFVYRQFKDMLNRTHYKRIDAPNTTLAQPLHSYDLRIEVSDASNLPQPSKGANVPGIIFIEGERIEYFIKENNTLRQIRRGTLGTGVKDRYAAGADIYDQNSNKTIPYKDVTQAQVENTTGTNDTYMLNFKASSVNEFEVFLAGRRLRKAAIAVFDQSVAFDSPKGDVIVPAEFTLENEINTTTGEIITSSIVLVTAPAADQQLLIVRKVGKLWSDIGESLGQAQNDIGFFLRAGTTKLPE
jgi:hypothetical protein